VRGIQLFAIKKNFSFIGKKYLRDVSDERSFSGAVGPQQSVNFIGQKLNAYVLQRNRILEMFGNIFYIE
jgi:hypothetical protein